MLIQSRGSAEGGWAQGGSRMAAVLDAMEEQSHLWQYATPVANQTALVPALLLTS